MLPQHAHTPHQTSRAVRGAAVSGELQRGNALTQEGDWRASSGAGRRRERFDRPLPCRESGAWTGDVAGGVNPILGQSDGGNERRSFTDGRRQNQSAQGPLGAERIEDRRQAAGERVSGWRRRLNVARAGPPVRKNGRSV